MQNGCEFHRDCSAPHGLGVHAALSGEVDPAYQQGSVFLKSLDPEMSPAEVARVLDIAMNPNSIFVSFRDNKRAKNANVCALVYLKCPIFAPLGGDVAFVVKDIHVSLEMGYGMGFKLAESHSFNGH